MPRIGGVSKGASPVLVDLEVDGTTLVVDEGNNRLGIGTASPLTDVQVEGSSGGVLTLSTSETTVVDTDILGQINFQAPLEGSGTDAILVGASISAVATDTFANNNNSTKLSFIELKSRLV